MPADTAGIHGLRTSWRTASVALLSPSFPAPNAGHSGRAPGMARDHPDPVLQPAIRHTGPPTPQTRQSPHNVC